MYTVYVHVHCMCMCVLCACVHECAVCSCVGSQSMAKYVYMERTLRSRVFSCPCLFPLFLFLLPSAFPRSFHSPFLFHPLFPYLLSSLLLSIFYISPSLPLHIPVSSLVAFLLKLESNHFIYTHCTGIIWEHGRFKYLDCQLVQLITDSSLHVHVQSVSPKKTPRRRCM